MGKCVGVCGACAWASVRCVHGYVQGAGQVSSNIIQPLLFAHVYAYMCVSGVCMCVRYLSMSDPICFVHLFI